VFLGTDRCAALASPATSVAGRPVVPERNWIVAEVCYSERPHLRSARTGAPLLAERRAPSVLARRQNRPPAHTPAAGSPRALHGGGAARRGAAHRRRPVQAMYASVPTTPSPSTDAKLSPNSSDCIRGCGAAGFAGAGAGANGHHHARAGAGAAPGPGPGASCSGMGSSSRSELHTGGSARRGARGAGARTSIPRARSPRGRSRRSRSTCGGGGAPRRGACPRGCPRPRGAGRARRRAWAG
jgi:hypothetical protein